MAATTRERLDALEAEVALLRKVAHIGQAYVDAIEREAYMEGRASILGGGSGQPARTPQAERWLHAVPPPAADAEAELEAGA